MANVLLPYTIVGVDIRGFSGHTTPGQASLRRGLFAQFSEACAESGVDLVDGRLRDDGDGGYGLFAANVPLPSLVSELPRRLAIGLRWRNADRLPKHHLTVRMAIHRGLAQRDGDGWVGHAFNHTSRLLN